MLAMILAEVSGSGLLAVVGIGAAVGLIIYLVASNAEEKAIVRSSLRQLDGYEVENVRDQELLNPLRERAIVPALQGLTDLGRRFTPVGYVDKVRMKFVYAGEPNADAVDRYLGTSGLFGTPEGCLQIIEKLKAIGVDEVACLIDFGVDAVAEVVSNDWKFVDAGEAPEHERLASLIDEEPARTSEEPGGAV